MANLMMAKEKTRSRFEEMILLLNLLDFRIHECLL